MNKLMTFLVSLTFCSPAFATKYYKSEGGSIKEIQVADFDTCSAKVYRKSGSNKLSGKHKKALMVATLKGQAINDLDAAKARLVSVNGSCTYGVDGESFN